MKKLLLILITFSSICYSQEIVAARRRVITGGNITIGITSNTGNDGGGDQNVAIFTPILTQNGSGYTLSAFHTVKGTSAGNMITGIYSSTTSGCPANTGVCPGTRVCQSSSTASSAGDQTLNPSTCGSLSGSTIYWLATIASSNTLTYSNNTGFGCPGNGLSIQFAVQGSFTLPASGGTTTLQSDCFENYVVLTCSSGCGATIPNYTVIDYSGGTNGSAVTTTNLNSSIHCPNGGFVVGGGGSIAAFTYANTPTQAFLNSAFAPCNQTSYTGIAPGLVLKRVTGSSDQPPNDNLIYGFNSNSHSETIAFWISTDTPQNINSTCDIFQLQGSSSSAVIYQMISNGTNLSFRYEQEPGSATFTGPNFSTSTYYFLTGQHNPGGTAHISAYDTTGTIVGTQVDITGMGAGDVTGFSLGEQGTCWTSTHNIWYGGFKIDPTGSAFPLLAVFPDSPAMIGIELSEMVRNGFIKPATINEKGVWFSFALNKELRKGLL